MQPPTIISVKPEVVVLVMVKVAVKVVVCWTVTPIQVSNSLKFSGSPAQDELTTIELNMLISRGSAANRFKKLFITVLP